MTKQETAEFLAKRVLHLKLKRKQLLPAYYDCDGSFWFQDHKILDFIYSPEGFFAVIKALQGENMDSRIYKAWRLFLFEQDYEAFYSAVIEVCEDGSS